MNSSLKQPSITTLDDLRSHLQTALELEHATIPPYFTAWLSANETENPEAAQIIRSVMLEEMLHLSLAANLMNAVGGQPNLTHNDFVPLYPHTLPHSARKFQVSIERLSPQAIKTFLKIERPEAPHAEPQGGEYSTIGQFYEAIAEGILYLCDKLGDRQVFSGTLQYQVKPEDYYAAGKLIVIKDRESALQAVEEIKEQGEGAHHTVFDPDQVIIGNGKGKEPAHYFRFKELELGRRYRDGDTIRSGPTGDEIIINFDSVYPIQSNTKISQYKAGSEIRCALELFCDSYHQLLASLQEAFSGNPHQMIEATARMFDLKNQGLALVRTPIAFDAHTTVGLAFTRDFVI